METKVQVEFIRNYIDGEVVFQKTDVALTTLRESIELLDMGVVIITRVFE